MLKQPVTHQQQTSESVKVIVRCRPFIERETKAKEQNVVTIDKQLCQVSLFRAGTSTPTPG